MRLMASSRPLPHQWRMGMTICIPKEQGCLSVDRQRPITLLTCKIKWLTGVLKLAPTYLVEYVVPRQQAGFIKGRQMEAHLQDVQQIWNPGRDGTWLSIDFAKAFNSTSHDLLYVFLRQLGVPEAWCQALIQFLRGPVHFLVGNQLTIAHLRPKNKD